MGILGLKIGADSTNNSTTNTQNFDNRVVNTVTKTSYDMSDNSVDNSSRIYEMGDYRVDNSVSVDGGAIQGMIDVATAAIFGAGDVAGRAIVGARDQTIAGYEYADNVFDSATLFANKTNILASDAFAQAAAMSVDAMSSVKNAFTSAQGATAAAAKATQEAYADAKGTTASQKHIVLAVLALAGILAVVMMRKGS